MIRRSIMFVVVSVFTSLLIYPNTFAEPSNPAKGREQLVQALDAAWVRIIENGKYRQILNAHGAPR